MNLLTIVKTAVFTDIDLLLFVWRCTRPLFYLRLLSFISLALYSYLKRDRSLFAHAYYNHVIISLYIIGSCNIY